MCPQCGREAPLLYRGALAYCSACNAPRVPLSASGVNLAGKPSKLGGTVAAVAGWIVLAVSLAIALLVGAVLQAIVPPVGWIVGGLIAVIGVAAAWALLMGGRFLQRTGDRASLGAKRDAVFALAQNQRGILRSGMVGKALGIPSVEADAFLTELSRDPESGVTLEVDADGKLFYHFKEIAPELPWPPPGVNLATAPADAGAARVAGPQLRAPRPEAGGEPLPVDDAEDESEGGEGAKRARQLS